MKPYQLKIALETGFRIPPTIITNSSKQAAEFIRKYPKVIYKPLNGYVWDECQSYATYTSLVKENEPALKNVSLFRSTPSIFQKQIRKKFEVRAQFFGATCFAVKIDSNTIKLGELDWRRHQEDLKEFQEFDLPDKVYEKCLKLMNRLGIVVGAFDFIIDKDDVWHYLEVNEAGQFLFLEKWCPHLPILDAFCEFLTSNKSDFLYTKKHKKVIKLEDVQKDLVEVA
ncbi:hypothetical protein DXX93_02850 [Thalassotalea euphylliae]|uniref:ATP-grasp domain-containing protein n=1 Tax=Thalassotalea euphylliae TaxID=1655234 RepID=A0A3E0TMV3_9GAMM|nr:hypothetical protein [Thalassotalea euphylliae]REL25590.1 hypothetical protein DXX93_02850 [Thalassotalea euphylliae]